MHLTAECVHDLVPAEVVVVKDWASLEALGDGVRGKIVLYDVPYVSYGETVAYRTRRLRD